MSINFASYPGVASNITNLSQCTPSLCPLDLAVLKSTPSLPANATFACIFGLLLIAQIGQAFFYKTWSFTFAMCLGLSLEIVGYLTCMELHFGVFSKDLAIVQSIFLSLSPISFIIAIYLTHARLITHFGTYNSCLSPRAHTLVFLCPSFIAMILQATGTGLAASATTYSSANPGVYTKIAGLAIQAITVLEFVLLGAVFFWNVRKDHIMKDNTDWAAGKISAKSDNRRNRILKVSILALSLSTALLLSSSILHLVFLFTPQRHNRNAFTSPLATSDPSFLICNGTLAAAAGILMTVFHPGRVLVKEWRDSSFWAGPKDERAGRGEIGGYENAVTDSFIQPVERPVFNKPWPI